MFFSPFISDSWRGYITAAGLHRLRKSSQPCLLTPKDEGIQGFFISHYFKSSQVFLSLLRFNSNRNWQVQSWLIFFKKIQEQEPRNSSSGVSRKMKIYSLSSASPILLILKWWWWQSYLITQRFMPGEQWTWIYMGFKTFQTRLPH